MTADAPAEKAKHIDSPCLSRIGKESADVFVGDDHLIILLLQDSQEPSRIPTGPFRFLQDLPVRQEPGPIDICGSMPASLERSDDHCGNLRRLTGEAGHVMTETDGCFTRGRVIDRKDFLPGESRIMASEVDSAFFRLECSPLHRPAPGWICNTVRIDAFLPVPFPGRREILPVCRGLPDRLQGQPPARSDRKDEGILFSGGKSFYGRALQRKDEPVLLIIHDTGRYLKGSFYLFRGRISYRKVNVLSPDPFVQKGIAFFYGGDGCIGIPDRQTVAFPGHPFNDQDPFRIRIDPFFQRKGRAGYRRGKCSYKKKDSRAHNCFVLDGLEAPERASKPIFIN